MNYVFDTSSLIVLKNFYPSTFPTLWANLEQLVKANVITSVREVLNELQNRNDTDFIQEWAKQNKSIFTTPSSNELSTVSQILAIPHFQMLIGKQAILKGTPVADPFIIAAAKVKSATVVTEEKFKPNAAKIPNVCQHFQVQCMNLENFLKSQQWKF